MSIISNTINSTIESLSSAVVSMGQSAVHSLIPNEYEYYLCAFTLYDSSKSKVGYMSFIVMPNQITESHTPIQNLVKTHGGIVTVFNSSFTPVDITIAGTFGKKWRLITGMTDPNSSKSSSGILNSGILSGGITVHSGYGLTKLLERIIERTTQLDDNNKPYTLIFHNYAFNTGYIVNITNYTFSQSYEQNMIWQYQITMKATGDESAFSSSGSSLLSTLSTVANNAISNGLTSIVSGMIGL